MDVIKRNTAIENPVEFLREDAQTLRDIQSGDDTVVLGTDYEVYAQVLQEDPRYFGYVAYTPSTFLGGLYIRHQVQGAEIDGRYVDIRWRPSVHRVAELQNEIGLKPGHNTLMFTRPRAGLITSPFKRAADISQGENTVSILPASFTSVESSMATGLILTPPAVIKELIAYAGSAVMPARKSFSEPFIPTRRSETDSAKLARLVDAMSLAVNSVSSNLAVEGLPASLESGNVVTLKDLIKDTDANILAALWGYRRSGRFKAKDLALFIEDVQAEHIEQLTPVVRSLKDKLETSKTP